MITGICSRPPDAAPDHQNAEYLRRDSSKWPPPEKSPHQPSDHGSRHGSRLPDKHERLTITTARYLFFPAPGTASATAFRRPAAVFPVAVSMEAAQTHQPPEAERNVVIEEQNPVFGTFKRSGNPQKQTAVHPVQALGQPAT